MAKQDEPVVLKYTPAREGDHITGVPMTDLTESDIRRIEPVQLHAMTVPGPSGQAMYTYVDTDLTAEQEAAAKAEAEAREKAEKEAAAKAAKAAKNAGKDGEA